MKTEIIAVKGEIMISIKNLSVDYFGHLALDNINVDIPAGCSIGIIGPNGAGKSTLIKALLDIVKKREGKFTLDGVNIKDKLRTIAYIPQKSSIDLTFPITVEDLVLTGTYPRLKLFQRPGKKERKIVDECLEELKITELRKKQISNLSGGQLQRVFIAKALAQNADTYFLDEPFVGIDLTSEAIIVDILKSLRDQGKTILTVHHDLHAVTSYFDKLLILNKSLIDFGDVDSVFTNTNIKKAYGDILGDLNIEGLED